MAQPSRKRGRDDSSSASFGTRAKQHEMRISDSGSDSDSDSESASSSDSAPEETSTTSRRNKHAPSEASAKKPVSRIREIPGLKLRDDSHPDIRFDAAYGKADTAKARKNYAFLDEYRKKEIAEMESMVRDPNSPLSDAEIDQIKLRLQSLRSRMDALKNKDFENSVLAAHKKQQLQNVQAGKQVNSYYLKKSEKRRLVQKAKYDSMKGRQREKVMERKRKKRLGKEFRKMEYRGIE